MTPQLFDNTVLISTVPGQHLELLQGQRRRHRLGARRRDRQAEVEVQHHLRRRQALRQPEDQQRRRSLVPAAGRQPAGASSSPSPTRRRCTGRRSSRTAPAAPARISTPTRSSPSTARPASGCGSGRRVRHDVRDYDLMIPAIVTTLPIQRRRHRGRARRRQDGQGVRLPRRQRQAAVDALRRQAPATTPGRCRARSIDDLPRRLRRGRDADGASPTAGSSCRGSTWRIRASATGLRTRSPGHERLHEGPRRPDRHRRRHRRGGLAAQAAVDGLRCGHRRERRRLHQRLRGHALRLRHPDRQDALDGEDARRDQLLPRRRRRHAARRRRGTPGSPRSRSSSSSPTRSRKQPAKEHTMKKLIVAAVSIAALTPAGLASARTDSPAHAAATAISVSGKEFSFRLSTDVDPEARKRSRSASRTSAPWCTTSHQRQEDAADRPGQDGEGRPSRSRRRAGTATSARCPATPRPA